MHRRPAAARLLAALAFTVTLLAPLALPAQTTVKKSESDPREYRALVLDNAMKVILVSDPETDMAAASLSVAVGSGADPRDRAGLAHFLEHMLFLGTAKYPQPGEYKDFISRHGGADNAYTAFDETNYFFAIEASHLEPALDRFAQFFVAPLFNPEYVSREREVVHSEYLGRRDDDRRRVHSAVQQAMNPDHPASTFSVGNLETLADREGRDLRQELLAFYRRYYSANLMALAVVGRQPLDTLEAWVRSRFSQVENRDVPGMTVDAPLYRPESLPARLDVVPKTETYSVSFSFPVPSLRPHWRAKPVSHIANLLGHEGETSLLAELKRRGWAQGLSAGAGFDHESGATIAVRIQLTAEGARHTDAIAALLFRAIDLVREQGVERWLFDENARLADIGFRFAEVQDPGALARRLASWQQEVPQGDVLYAPYAHEQWRPELIRSYLDLLRPDNVLVARVAPGLDTDRTSPWYETPYRLVPLDMATRERWRTDGDGEALAIPEPNPFIPENLALLGGASGDVPVELITQPGFRLWHLQDTDFGLPKADFFFAVRSPVANSSPRNSLLSRLFVDTVNDQLDAFAYPADLAGLSFRLYPHSRGLSLRISGYDERQPQLLARILDALKNPVVDPKRFEILREELKRALENSRKGQPYGLAMGRLQDILVNPAWTVDERLALVDTLRAPELQRFASALLRQVEVVALAHGNLDADHARALGERVHAALVADATPVSVPRARVMRLRRGDRLAAQLDTEHPESSLVLYLQGPDKSLPSRAKAGLLGQVLNSPFFDALRTEKKLGYVVFARPMPILDVAGVAFIVQSPVAGAGALQDEVQAFLSRYAGVVADMTEEELEQHKRALVARVLEEERQLAERSDRFWNEIDRRNFRFDTRERLADAIRAVSLEAFRQFYDRMLANGARRQLTVRTVGQSTPPSPPRGEAEMLVTPTWAQENRPLLPG